MFYLFSIFIKTAKKKKTWLYNRPFSDTKRALLKDKQTIIQYHESDI